jgi:phage FluMu protein Com
MKNFSSGSRYFIFKCQYPDCNEDIPVVLYPSAHPRKGPSTESCLEKDEGKNEAAPIDMTCPYCNSLNHFTMMSNHKEVNRHIFEAENRAVNAMQFKRSALMVQD